MTDEIQIPFPVTFNPLKHHRNYILKFLEKTTPAELKKLSDSVCDNYIDMYTGNFAPEIICSSVIDFLKSIQVLGLDDFELWIGLTGGFRQIKLGDQSEWIVRKGTDPKRYIHIHPAKTGLFSIRFKGSTLKTVYRLKIEYKARQHSLSLEMVNKARIEIGLSPIKKIEPGKGILKCWELFFQN